MTSHIVKALLLTLIVGSLAVLAQNARQVPAKADSPKAGVQASKAELQASKSKETDNVCGTFDDISKKLEVCTKSIIDIFQGTIEKWPRNDSDVANLCLSFQKSEKCVRDVARRCTKGLQRTILSTLANSVARVRKRECSVSKYPEILNTTMCIERNQGASQGLIKSIADRLIVVDEQVVELHKKTTGLCCVFKNLEKDMELMFKPICPKEGAFVLRLYRTIVDEVLDLICRKPNCEDLFKGYVLKKQDKFNNIITIALRIVFSLG